MNFLETIKQNLYDQEMRQGLRNHCVVNTKSLRELIDHFEQLDSFERSKADDHASLTHKLHNVLHALYRENHDSEQLMLTVMDTLKPMIERRVKENEIDRVYQR